MKYPLTLLGLCVTSLAHANYDPEPLLNCIEASVGLSMISAMGHNPNMEKVRDYDSKADDLIDTLVIVIADRGRTEKSKEIKKLALGHAISVRSEKGTEVAKVKWMNDFYSVRTSQLGGQTCHQFAEN
ncbi:hypothetical protein AB6E53_02195 [Vibrio breoganii]|uniref:Uncharacterized protein n=1 Tax=Vibrio breoganii TaxID=553239 RepID=A0AAP8MWE2_9VIBR|nr:hypothetical protein [Vibrio breoganii]PMP10198.1 hypothetical protein BCS93_11015 [Vibrio breoganii]